VKEPFDHERQLTPGLTRPKFYRPPLSKKPPLPLLIAPPIYPLIQNETHFEVEQMEIYIHKGMLQKREETFFIVPLQRRPIRKI